MNFFRHQKNNFLQKKESNLKRNFSEISNNHKDGFTLVEMLVSIALFSIVLTIAIGSIFTIIDSSRKSQTLTLVMNNLNFSLEVMTRDIKTADPAEIEILGTFDDPILKVIDQEGDTIKYLYDSDDQTIRKSVKKPSQPESGYISIISDDVVIESFIFEKFDGDNGQPLIILVINGYAQITERIRSDFDIQTSVSPRKLNI